MNFSLLSIGSVYPGSLELFYKQNYNTDSFSYEQQNRLLLGTTSEFIGSYYRNFRKIDVEANAIVTNDTQLQTKWQKEHSLHGNDPLNILFEQVRYYRPDALFIENLSAVDDNWINYARKNIKSIKLIIGYHCAPFNHLVDKSIKACDIILTCTPGLKDFFSSKGKETHLVYHGFDEDILTTLEPTIDEKHLDLVFSGSLTTGGDFHNERIRLIEAILKEGIEIRLYVNLENSLRIRAKQILFLINTSLQKAGLSGLSNKIKILDYGRIKVENYSSTLLARSLPPVFGTDMLNLFRRSKIVLNYHIGIAGNYAGNMRMFEVTGAGSCLLSDSKRNMNDLFTEGEEVVLYNGKDDCVRKIKWLLDHDEERKAIAESGNRKTLTKHTVYNRCEIIRNLIESELNK